MTHLTSITIENFRGYGPDFALDIPFQAGVVLLTGPNGTGKTTLFEAIEWALTGSVERLRNLAERDDSSDKLQFIRRGSGKQSCAVHLGFTDAGGQPHVVERLYSEAARQSLTAGTDIAKIVSLLCADRSWHVDEKSLSKHLLMTHFHPQSAQTRFISKAARERWGWYSHLAGADTIELVRNQLSRCKVHMTKLRQQYDEQASSAAEALTRWNEDVRMLAELKLRQRSVGNSLSPAGAVERLREIASALGAQLDEPRLSGAELTSVLADILDEYLTSESARVSAEIERVRRGREVLDSWRTLDSRARAATQISRRATERAEELQGKLTAAQDQHRTLKDALTECQRHEALAESRVDDLRNAHASMAAQQTLTPQLASTTQALQAAAEELARCEARELEARTKTEELESLLRRSDEIRRRKKETEEAVAAAARLPLVIDELAAQQERSRRIKDEVAVLEAQVAQVDAAQARSTSELTSAHTELDRLHRQSEQLAAAVAEVARVLPDDATACPVCQAQYESDELRRRAHRAAVVANPAVEAALARVSQAKSEIQLSSETRARLSSRLRETSATLGAANERLAQLAEHERRILGIEIIAQLPRSGLNEALIELLDTVTGQELEIGAELKNLADEDPRANLARAARAVESQRIQRDGLTRRQQEQEALAAQHRATLSALEHRGLDVGDNIEQVTQELAAAVATLDAHQQATRQAKRSLTEHSEIVASLAADHQESARQLNESKHQSSAIYAELDETLRAWTRLRFSDSPSAATLEETADSAQDRQTALEAAGLELKRLRSDVARHQDAGAVAVLEGRLSRTSSGDRDQYTRSLAERAERTRDAAERAAELRDAADTLSLMLKRDASEFISSSLSPVERIFRSYLKVLIQDERYQRITMSSRTSARESTLDYRLEDGQSDPPEPDKLLSEGQMAELSVAALLASSTAFRWSTWRALLLDDPTQYNDLVHATSFLDLVRDLAGHQRYQVFMSTHDSQQARFFQRKLTGARVPCLIVDYLGADHRGVQWRTRRVGC